MRVSAEFGSFSTRALSMVAGRWTRSRIELLGEATMRSVDGQNLHIPKFDLLQTSDAVATGRDAERCDRRSVKAEKRPVALVGTLH